MNFLEAREALHEGKKIRHTSMPEDTWIMMYRRGFGTDMPILVDGDGNLSGAETDFISLFWATVWEDDYEWEAKD